MSVQSDRQRLLLSKLNEQLTCRLCSGYFIDATTIIECLHSFCRSCIVKYLEKSKYCPICEVQVHKSKPLLNIRPDHTLQDIVYKLVPGCYQNEMRCRKEFYAKHPEVKASTVPPEGRGEPVESHIYSPDESLNLSLEYHNPNVNTDSEDEESESTKPVLPRRYLRCPAAVTIFHLQKLIRSKYGLSDAHRVDILYKEELLSPTYTLMDIMYIYHWRRKVPLHLSYRIFESSSKRIKISEDNVEFKKSLSDCGIDQMELQDDQPHKEWKEVQLKISEAGVMSVTNITSPESKRNVKTMELDDKVKSELNSLIDTKASKELIEQNESMKDKSKAKNKEEPEGKVTRSATKLNSSKSEEVKSKSEEKTKMDTRVSLKEVAKSEKSQTKDVKSDSQPLVNNNSINSEGESENQKQQVKSTSAGSKINALSAKLQFHPKVGQVNNTYSKKGTAKEKKTVTYNLKSSDSKQSTKNDNKSSETPSTQNSSKSESQAAEQTSKTSGVTTVTTSQTTKTASVNTETTSVSSTKTSSANSTTSSKTTVAQTSSSKTSVSQSVISKSSPVISQTSTTNAAPNTVPVSQSTTSQAESKVSLEKTKTKTSASESAAVKGKAQSSEAKSSTSSTYSSKSPVSTCSTSTTNSTLPQFSIQTPLMSIFPTSMKNTGFSSTVSASSTTVTLTTSSANSSTKSESKSDSIPPCPDAIPLSMMKSTIRKSQLLSKGATLSESSVKSAPGSKIDDICAKIGENSKEKNKLENQRNKPEIPGLLEIPKKPSLEVMKQIPSIHVPIFKPSTKEPSFNSSLDTYKILPSISSHSLPASMSSQKVPSSKKRVSPFSYKTLRTPPRSWNPTISKNSYLAIKNQAKELQQQQVFCETKEIQSKPSKIFTMRNPPRYLGNPASGVKPMYNVMNEKDKDQATSSKGHAVMTKLDPQTLQPIVSMPPYSSKDRGGYQSGPFSRDIRSTSSSVSPRNSPVNMLSTSPFIPSPTPNTNPRLIYSTLPSSFPAASRFPHSIMPHSPLGLQPPLGAFHNLPQIKFYQRSSYTPQTGGYSCVAHPPTVQRIPPTSHSNSPKSSKVEAKSSSSSGSVDAKLETIDRSKVTVTRKPDGRGFSLGKVDGLDTKQPSKLDFLSKVTAVTGVNRTKVNPVAKSPVPKVLADKSQMEKSQVEKSSVEKSSVEKSLGEKKDSEAEAKTKIKTVEEKKDSVELKGDNKEHSRVNGDTTEGKSSKLESKEKDKTEEDKSVKKDTTNGMAQSKDVKSDEDGTWRKTAEEVQAKKIEVQRNKAES